MEEAKLIKELVTELNARYDDLNEELNSIIQSKSRPDSGSTQNDTLSKYFNLCAEEYLFYKKGYIYREVWDAWFSGMRGFFSAPPRL